jgi:hypothetical protein
VTSPPATSSSTRAGRCYGTIKSESAEVHGDMQGEVVVKNLISISSSGSVSGNVRYGKLALEQGGNLSAEVRNVPPSLAGRSRPVGEPRQVRAHHASRTSPRSIPTTPRRTSPSRSPMPATASSPWRAAAHPSPAFTQADLASGKVSFTHDWHQHAGGELRRDRRRPQRRHLRRRATVKVHVSGLRLSAVTQLSRVSWSGLSRPSIYQLAPSAEDGWILATSARMTGGCDDCGPSKIRRALNPPARMDRRQCRR